MFSKVGAKKTTITGIPKKFTAVKKALNDMYNGYCCYCEGKTGKVDYPHIEHRKPRKPFPEDTYDWDNLHLSCVICNTEKGKKWNEIYPILDAVRDIPLSEHFSYNIDDAGIYVIPRTNRGKTTRQHTDLNRDKLLAVRAKLCSKILEQINLLNSRFLDIT